MELVKATKQNREWHHHRLKPTKNLAMIDMYVHTSNEYGVGLKTFTIYSHVYIQNKLFYQNRSLEKHFPPQNPGSISASLMHVL